MKKLFALALALVMALSLTACNVNIGDRTNTPAANTDTPGTLTPTAGTETPGASLSSCFPSDRITLPSGAHVIEVFNDFADKGDGDECWETTVLTLTLTMTRDEAVTAFTPMLNSGDVDQFVAGDLSTTNIPLEVRGAYPDVQSSVELFAKYPYTDGGIGTIKATFFTKEDGQTIVIAYIEVRYNGKPSAGPNSPPVPADTPSGDTPAPEPYALNVKSGQVIYLGMSRDAAEAVLGAPVEDGYGGKIVYEGLILAYRGDTVVYILIDDARWNCNGIVELDMPTQEAVEKLGMTFEDGCTAYTLKYPDNGSEDYEASLTLFVGDTVSGIIMADRQYGLTMQ